MSRDLALIDRIAKRARARRERDLASSDASRPPWDDWWYTQPGGGASRSSAAMNVTPDSALSIGAVFRAVRLLSDDLAQLPLQMFELRPDRGDGKPGGKRRLRTPLAEVLAKRPNARQTSFEFRQMMTAHLLLRGNAYARIVSGPSGFVDQLEPLNPALVRPERLSSGRVLYLYRTREREERLTQEEVFHLRGFSTDPEAAAGLSPVTLARVAFGLTMATEEFGAREFSQKPRPGLLLTHPNRLDGPAAKRISESVREVTSGPDGWNYPLLLEEGMTASTVGMSHDDAQFLETRQFQVTEIARWFGVPPHMIGDLSKSSFSNIEQQSIDYVVHSLLPWIVLWEQSIERDLVLDDAFPQFNVEGLLRGEGAARAQAYQLYINMRAMTPNEVRARENMDPVPWGDEPAMPQGAPAPAAESPSPRRAPPQDEDSALANRVAPHLNGKTVLHG